MKNGRFFSLFFLLLFPLGGILQAQENVDTNYYDPAPKMDRFVFTLGYAGWMNKAEGVQIEPWSYSTSMHYMQDIPFGESGFATAIGLGFSSHNVYYNSRFIESPDGPTGLKPYADGEAPKRNKLSTNYFSIPVELRFRTSGSPAFKVAFGGQIGYLFNLHNKLIDEEGKRKVYDIQGVDPLRYGLKGRIGYGRWNAFVHYGLDPFFKKGEGPDIQHFSGGLAITLF